ncbi:hypothetical protein RRG08_054342 [Elysia crispata]|uniref:Uncharacterized protein n=1 Tax=Elysia crispata TaxID=231223 RepID=A0AAE1EA82_9GAST|nr:hypothetical protein RRG08_054342 [Elysia crispata]
MATQHHILKYKNWSITEGRLFLMTKQTGRWNCWYDAVACHKENMDVFLPYIQEELQHSKSESLTYLANLIVEDRMHLDAEMHFIQDRCKEFVQATDLFQCQMPVAVKVWSRLESPQDAIGDCGITMREASQYFTEEMTSNQRNHLQKNKACSARLYLLWQPKWKNTPAVRDSQAFLF